MIHFVLVLTIMGYNKGAITSVSHLSEGQCHFIGKQWVNKAQEMYGTPVFYICSPDGLR
jgi:methanogenic corrinoid protein MtbC1